MVLRGLGLPPEVRAERAAEDTQQSVFPSAIAVVEGIAGDAFEVAGGERESACQSVHLALQVHQETLIATFALGGRVLTVKFGEFMRCQCYGRHAIACFPALP